MLFKKRDVQPGSSARPPVADRRREDSTLTGGGRTVLGPKTRIRGSIRGEGPVTILGQLDGSIVLRGALAIASGGLVTAEVEVRSLELAGEARGSVRANARVLVFSSGIFEGDIATPVLQVQPGSIVSGRARVLGVPGPDRDDLSH